MVWKGEWTVRPVGSATTSIEWRGVTYLVPRQAMLSMSGHLDEPDLMVRVEVVDEAPVVRQLHVLGKDNGKPLRDAHLDGISMDKLARRIVLELAVRVDRSAAGRPELSHVENQTEDMWQVVGALAEAQGQSRGRPSEALLRQVADIYRSHPRAPTKAVEEALGLSTRTAARRVKQAEAAGYLPPTTKGRKRGV